MEEVKLWRVDSQQNLAELTQLSQLEAEAQLEEMLVANPDLLEPDLELVGRQTPAAGGWLDLLGVDSSGRLTVFELKRGTLGRDAVAQVLDYASFLTELALDDLCDHIRDRSGQGGIPAINDFSAWYQERFSDLQELLPLRLVLVGLGVDDVALRIRRFLSQGSVEIEVVTFYGFKSEGETLIARQLPVRKEPPSRNRTGTVPKGERLRKLDEYLESVGLTARFDLVRTAIRDCLPASVYENPLKYGVSLQMDVRNTSGTRGPRPFFGVYAAYTTEHAIEISLNSVTKRHNPREYEALASNLPLSDWRHGGKAIVVGSDEEWDRIEPEVTRFARAVHESWLQYRNDPMSHSPEELDAITSEVG